MGCSLRENALNGFGQQIQLVTLDNPQVRSVSVNAHWPLVAIVTEGNSQEIRCPLACPLAFSDVVNGCAAGLLLPKHRAADAAHLSYDAKIGFVS
jgi:hypothetical protein